MTHENEAERAARRAADATQPQRRRQLTEAELAMVVGGDTQIGSKPPTPRPVDRN
jgi:hypothetical protein